MAGKRKTWNTPFVTGNAVATQGTDRQALFQEMHDALIAIGLVQTSDTGQLADFSSVAADVTSSSSFYNFGYRVYKFTDSIGDIYLKVSFGCTGITNTSYWDCPSVYLYIGTGTNGAGTLTNSSNGIGFPLMPTAYTGDVTSRGNTGNLMSYAYAGEGIFWMALKVGGFRCSATASLGSTGIWPADTASGIPWLFFAVARPVAEDGTILDNGAAILMPKAPDIYTNNLVYHTYSRYPTVRTISFPSGAQRLTNTPAVRPCLDLVGLLGGNVPVSKVLAPFDAGILQLHGMGGVSAPQVANGDTMEIAMAGTTPLPMIAPHRGVPGPSLIITDFANALGLPANDTMLMAWEGDVV